MLPKSKKGGLKEEQVQRTVKVVQQYWPQYPITPNSIINTTRAFVLNLYADCVQNLDEKLAFATKTQPLPYPPGLGEEELLYLKLSQIPSLAELDFKLGDLYTFEPVRVNSLIFIIMHFLMFTDSVMDKTVAICNTVFDAKEKMERNKEELQQLKQDKLDRQIKFTAVKVENKKLKELAAIIAPEYENNVALIKEIENKCKDKVKEMEQLNSEYENIQEEVQKLEKTQSHLKSQIVTEEEYTSLKSTLESLQTHEKNLEEIDHSNGLFEQKQYMEHLQMCLRELNHLELSENIFKLCNHRGQLKDEKESLHYAVNLQNSSESEINALKTQLDSEKRAIEIEKKDLEEKLRIVTEEGMLKENKLKKKYQQINRDNQVKIKDLQRILEKREADFITLPKKLKEKYNAIRQTQDMALQNVRSFVNKVNAAHEDKHVL